MGALVLIAVVAFLLFGHPGGVFAKSVKEFATRDLDVKSSIEPATSTTIGHFRRGDPVSGKWVTSKGGQGKWLKVKLPDAGTGYIWSRNLSEHQRPELTSTGGGGQVASVSSVVYAEPDQKAAVVDDISQGEMVATVGATSDGWTEMALNGGGAGYVKSAVFQGVPGPGTAPTTVAADGAPEPGRIVHYVCSSDRAASADQRASTLSFYLDEGRACINHRYAYFVDDTGGLKRVMLNDRDHRVSVLTFTQSRKAFSRVDFDLSPADYANLLKTSSALESITCPPPNDAVAAAAIKADLVRSTPQQLDEQTLGVQGRHRAWQCLAS
jgi:hypothetical protein